MCSKNTKHPPFFGQWDWLSLGRSLRLAVIQDQYRQQNLTLEQAYTLLKGPIKPETEPIDDAEYLKLNEEDIT